MLILAEIQNFFLVSILVAFFLLICVVLILTILIQRPQGGGLSAAFGAGAGSGQTAFGTKTGDALTYATIAMFVVYLGFAIALNYIARPSGPAPGQPIVAPDEREERRTGATAPEEPARDREPPAPQPPIVPEVEDDAPATDFDPEGTAGEDPNG